jgi:hypothetical protein
MTRSRRISIPIEHIEAEIIAYPLSSETSFQLGLTSLCKKPKNQPNSGIWQKNIELQQTAEKVLLGTFPSVSVDEFIYMRDYLWYTSLGNEETSLADFLALHSKRYLDTHGGKTVPTLSSEDWKHPEASESQARTRWRWLSFALPPDLLISAHPDSQFSTAKIHKTSAFLRQMLAENGFAEVHLHVGAALEFHDYWVGLMYNLSRNETPVDAFESIGATFNNGRELGAWFLRTAIIRYCLAKFISQRSGQKFTSFQNFFHSILIPELRELTDAPALFIKAFDELCLGKLDSNYRSDYSKLRQIYRSFVGEISLARSAEDIQRSDPIFQFFPMQTHNNPTPEMCFTRLCLSYLTSEGKNDLWFAELFWQVTRMRCIAYRYIIQRPLTPGLQWFIRHFGRIKIGRPFSESVLLEKAIEIDGYGYGLRSLEVRTSPAADWTQIRKMIEHTAKLANEKKDLELGWVLHFTKERSEDFRKGISQPLSKNSNADPRWEKNTSHFRYAHYYLTRREQAVSLGRLFQECPKSLIWIRGIDMCTDELGIPLWVLNPLFRYIRNVSQIVSQDIMLKYGLDVPPVHFTAHVGEEYVHLLGGLRRISEAIEFLDLGEGDRLGHALALGVEPIDWALRAGRIALPKEERFFDLIWEWRCYSRGFASPCSAARLTQIEHEIIRLGQEIFDSEDKSTPYDYVKFTQQLYDSNALLGAGFSHGIAYSKDNLLYQYLTDGGVFERGQQLLWIDPEKEGETLLTLQNALRSQVARLGLVVEVNPSSNLLIGDFSDLINHPLWRLLPPIQQNDQPPPVSVAIGSDDSILFSTNLPDEYQTLMDALILRDGSHANAYEWIRRVQRIGLHSRFTLPLETLRSNTNESFDPDFAPIRLNMPTLPY